MILQPRRLAARLLAARVADELGVPLGREVGYQIRFENVTSPETKIRFVTEGVLLRQMIDDPKLSGVSVLIFDEFHERSLNADLGLALALETQSALNESLKLQAILRPLHNRNDPSVPPLRGLDPAPVVRDHDDKGVFERTVEFAKKTGIEECEFLILTPYPNTRLHTKLMAEGRIIDHDLSKYTTTKVVYRPKLMTPDELYEGYLFAWKEFYSKDIVEDTEDGVLIKTMAQFPINPSTFDRMIDERYRLFKRLTHFEEV